MTNANVTNVNVDPWSVLFNVPNFLAWIRIILMFVGLRYFGQQNYLLFVIYHTISGFLDSLDGILARYLNQKSSLGEYFEFILDKYAHFIMYACISVLYQSYIAYFYLEIALELWTTMFDLSIHTLSTRDKPLLEGPTFLSTACSVSIYHHRNLRLFNWYGPDIFHTTLVIRYILINDNKRLFTRYIQRYVSLERVYSIMKIILVFTGFFAILRTCITSCFLFDKLYRLASAG